MPGTPISENIKPFIGVVGGNIVQKVDKDTEGARCRDYVTSDGVEGKKWELVFMNWKGIIHDISFEETDFGEVCKIDLGDAILCLNTSSRYFTDFACKLFSGDLTQEFLFHPYSILGEEGKKKQGISLQQHGQKLKNYFYNPETKKYHDEFPPIDEEKLLKLKKNYWKTYFPEVEAFLVEKLQKLDIPGREERLHPKTTGTQETDSEEIPNLDDLPF